MYSGECLSKSVSDVLISVSNTKTKKDKDKDKCIGREKGTDIESGLVI